LTSGVTISFSRTTVLYGVSKYCVINFMVFTCHVVNAMCELLIDLYKIISI